jgi:hypothetical protein
MSGSANIHVVSCFQSASQAAWIPDDVARDAEVLNLRTRLATDGASSLSGPPMRVRDRQFTDVDAGAGRSIGGGSEGKAP